jgi:hypothetical protein
VLTTVPATGRGQGLDTGGTGVGAFVCAAQDLAIMATSDSVANANSDNRCKAIFLLLWVTLTSALDSRRIERPLAESLPPN